MKLFKLTIVVMSLISIPAQAATGMNARGENSGVLCERDLAVAQKQNRGPAIVPNAADKVENKGLDGIVTDAN